MNSKTIKRLGLVMIGGVLAACGSDGGPDEGVGLPDGGGQQEEDAGGGGELDAGPEPVEDAAVEPDAGSLLPSCSLEEPLLEIPIDARGSHTWDVLQVGSTFHLVYEVTACESQPLLQAQRLEHLTFRSSGEFGEAKAVVNGTEGVCSWARTPSLSVKGEEVYLYYSSNSVGTNELYQLQLGSQLGASRVTTDTGSDREDHTQVAPFGAADLLAYVNVTPINPRVPDVCEVVTRRAGSEENVIVAADAEYYVSGLELKAFPAESTLGGVLGYIATKDEKSAIKLQLLDKSGKASGEPVTLSEQVSAYSNIHVSMLPTGSDVDFVGAVVYGVGPDDLHTELRFRTIAHDGTIGAEKKLTSGNRNAQGVSLTPFGDGYMLAFRAIRGADTNVVVKLVNKRGDSAANAERVMAEADASGSPPRVFATNDGRITVVFDDHNGDGMFLRAVRGICDP